MTSEVHMQNLLAELTDAVILGESAELVRERYAIPRADSDDLLSIIKRLNHTLETVQPSDKFATQLKAELMGQAQAGMFGRIRRLPARVQMAAGAALVTGFLLIVRRFFLGDDSLLDESFLSEREASWRN